MANAIVAVLPSAIAPHMHWFMCLFSIPLLMVLGTDAFYYALLPIIIGVVEPFGVTPETVAAERSFINSNSWELQSVHR